MTKPRPANTASEGRQATVLIVDDNPLLRFSLSQEISEAGFRVREAGTADEAETVLGTGAQIDLLVTDVEMPGRKDGIALAGFVRTHFPHVPVIVVSGKAAPARAADVAHAFFAKPYDTASLIQRIRMLLDARASPACNGAEPVSA